MNTIPFKISFLLCVFSISPIGVTETNQYQTHQSITTAARAFLLNSSGYQPDSLEIDISPIDHRLRLSRCAETLETFSPPGADSSGKTTVGVRCNAPTPWTLYVSGNVAINKPVVIAKKSLTRGSVITAEDILLTEKDISRLLRGHFSSAEEVIGKKLRRPLPINQVITPGSLQSEQTVSRGQKVTILAGNGNIEVRMKGKALRNGNRGDLIPVLNISSKKKLEARVVAAGSVRIE